MYSPGISTRRFRPIIITVSILHNSIAINTLLTPWFKVFILRNKDRCILLGFKRHKVYPLFSQPICLSYI